MFVYYVVLECMCLCTYAYDAVVCSIGVMHIICVVQCGCAGVLFIRVP